MVARELRVGSRKPWTYWSRPVFGVAGIAAAMVMFYEGAGRVRQGEDMLWLLSVVTMILALLSGCLHTADCISSEKREDTLGFLFLTNLRGYDIVVGKICGHAMTTAGGLLAVLPVFFLPLLAGGVTWAETFRVLVAIAASFCFAVSVGIWISSRSTDARNATMATVAAVSLMVLAPILWLAILDELFRGRPSPVGIPQMSPGMLLYFARERWFTAPGAQVIYWSSVGIFTVASVVLGALASRSIPKNRQTEHKSPAPQHEPDAAGPLSASVLQSWRPVNRFSIANPFTDLLLRRQNDLRWGRFLKRAAGCLVLALLLFSFLDDDCYPFALLTLFAMHAATKFVFAFDATRALNDDKKTSALELLLATPLSEAAIAQGQADAFRLQFRRTVKALLVLTGAAQLVTTVNPELHLRGDDFVFVSSFIWAPMIWTWSDYHTVTWLGMRHALTKNSHTRAMLRTLADMLVVPWAPYFFVIFWMANRRFSEEAAAATTFGWAIGGAIYQQIRARRKKSCMLREFRELASGEARTRTNTWNVQSICNFFRVPKVARRSLLRS